MAAQGRAGHGCSAAVLRQGYGRPARPPGILAARRAGEVPDKGQVSLAGAPGSLMRYSGYHYAEFPVSPTLDCGTSQWPATPHRGMLDDAHTMASRVHFSMGQASV